MNWKKLGRRVASVALAPVTGGASLGGLSDKVTGKVKDFLLGQDPDDVKLPPEVVAAQERRKQLLDMALSGGNATASQDAARAAAALAGSTARTDLANRLQSVAAGARGLGALGARRESMRRTALGEADIAGRVAEGSANAVANAVGQDQSRRLQQIGMAAEMLTDQERAALEAEEYRKKNARKGVAGEILGMTGAAVGTAYGGPAAGKAAGEIGYGAGSMFERS